ncbi:hypothetical protein [Marilutibacter maris]|nr:hypothetical protein [Lysobacter maris]
MKPILLALCLFSPAALACDTSHLGLSGSLKVETCSPQESSDCINAAQALYEYSEAIADSDALFTIALQANPWRMYDGQMRILTVEDLADTIRPQLDGKVERVELIGSWTGVSPAPGVPSLAERVSKALGGFPVTGEDGFLWLSQDGTRRTTRQAFTLREGAGAYFLPKNADVFSPLVAGWPAFVQERVGSDDPELMMLAAAAWDVFFLCPDKALASFEQAAAMGNAIAAYNAATMRLERDADGDRDAAIKLLERGVELGDDRSRSRLKAERAGERSVRMGKASS